MGASLGANLTSPRPYAWYWPNAAARLAQGVTAAQLGWVGYQVDIQREYRLIATSPTQWAELRDAACVYTRSVCALWANASFTVVGLAHSNTFGSLVGVVPAAGSVATMLARTLVATTSVATNIAVYRASGGAAPIPAGGFRDQVQFTVETVSANMRWFVGLAPAITTNSDPADYVNCFGIGRGAGQANVQLYHNDAAGAATVIDLGAAFPANTPNIAYDFQWFTVAGASYGYQLRNMNTGATVSGTIATELPFATIAHLWHVYASNNGDAASDSLGVASVQCGQRSPF